jgi:Mg/Co/Ni transporter MgtE
VTVAELVRAGSELPLGSVIESETPTVTTDADVPDVAVLMSDFNLLALPVLDGEGRPVGLIGVDDVLEQVLPEEWRRRGGLARP